MSDYFESGFSVREPMWHRKGDVKDRYPKDWDEAREWAGLQWDPVEVPVFVQDSAGAYVPLSNFKGVARSDTAEMLTVRTGDFQIIDHAAMGQIMEAILEQPGVKYETAGSVHGGKGVWALAYLDEPITIPGDNSITLPYLAVTNRHDGTGSCAANSTTVKIVCANTFAASELEGERNGTIFRFRHTGDWHDRIDEARATITGLRKDFNRYAEVAAELLAVRVTPAQKELFVTQFVPSPPETLISDRVVGNVEKARAAVRTILASPTEDGIGDTAWGLVQAAGEYLDHYRAYRTLDSAYTRQLLRPEPMKSKAIRLVREVVLAA